MSLSSSRSRFEDQMAAGRIYARTGTYRRAVAFALSGIRKMLELAPKSYVSISFGKQSIVMAHLVQRVRPDVPMFFLASTETWAMHDFDHVISEYCERFSPNLTIIQTDRLTGAATWKEARDAGDRDLQEMVPRDEWDGCFIGLAADESKPRRITLAAGARQRNGHPTIYRYADGKYRCCPLMNWGLRELAAYIGEHDLPLLSIYKEQGLEARTTARLTKKARNHAGLQMLTHGKKELSALLSRYADIREI